MPASFPSLRRAAAILLLTSPVLAHGEDPRDVIKKAQEAERSAPAVRITIVTTDLNSKHVTTRVDEFVQPASSHTTEATDGKVTQEVVTDGKKTFLRHDGTEFRQVPGALGPDISQARKSVSMDTLAEAISNVQLAGHENVGTTPASVYTFKSSMMGLVTQTKLWISEQGHLPIKSESETHGELKMGDHPGMKVDRAISTTLEYDPSLKIVLPGS